MTSSGPGESPARRLMTNVSEHLAPEFKKVLLEKSKVPEAELEQHILAVRDKAWKVWPYPCLGMLRFLNFQLPKHKQYQQVLSILRADPSNALLDLGCGFGQEIRKLVADGVKGDQLYGADLHLEFVDMGYDLFKDSQKDVGAHFFEADVFKPETFEKELGGKKFDVVNADLFLHLFSLEDQKKAVKIILSNLLKDKSGSLVLGHQVGSNEPGERSRLTNPGKTMYRHDGTTFEKLWKDVAKDVGVEVEVQTRLEAVEAAGEAPPGKSEDRFRLYFEVERV